MKFGIPSLTTCKMTRYLIFWYWSSIREKLHFFNFWTLVMGHKRRAVESAAESVGWPLKCWKWWEISNLFQISDFKCFPDSWPDSSRTDQEWGMHLNWSGMREPYPNVQKSLKYPLRYCSLIPDQIQVGLIRNEGTLMSSKIPIGINFPDSWLDPSWTDQE